MENANSAVAEVEETNAAEETEQEAGSTIAKIDKGNMVLTLESIDKDNWKGFQFYIPAFKSLGLAEEHFTKLSKTGKSGEAIVLELVNAAMAQRMRGKASSKITFNAKGKTVADRNAYNAEREAWLQDPVKKILVTEDEAMEYVPGERETSSLSGFLKLKQDLLKSIKALKEAGNLEEARVQRDKYLEVAAEIDRLQKEQDEEVLSALD